MSEFVCVNDYKERADAILGQQERDYLNSGADDEITLKWSEDAFKRLVLRPRVLVDVTTRSLETTLLGLRVRAPIGISPTGFAGVYHPGGEVALAHGASQAECCYIMSSATTMEPENVAAAVPDGLRWFQVYVSKERGKTARNVKRAVAAGFRALVLTADLPIAGKRRCNAGRPFMLPSHVTIPLLSTRSDQSGIPGAGDMAPDVTWKDISWLKSLSGLPVIVKGVLCREDAELAISHGADAIVVSNHGGRQLDTAPASIDVLPEIVSAVAGRVEVYLDGGIRTGTDVLKAIALGARGVFVGRPAIWGLVCKGSDGVRDVLNLLQTELSTAMALSGCSKIADINQSLVFSRPTMANL